MDSYELDIKRIQKTQEAILNAKKPKPILIAKQMYATALSNYKNKEKQGVILKDSQQIEEQK